MKSYNTQITKHILGYLEQAKERIWVNVPWFTHRELFQALYNKASQGVSVHVIIQDDDINRQTSFQHEELNTRGGKVYRYRPENSPTGINHEKYCVIDDQYIIYGSFNWTYNADLNNLESILVGEKPAEYDLIKQFEQRFTEVLALFFSADPTPAGTSLLDTSFALKLKVSLLQNECGWLEAQIHEIQNAYGKIEQYIQLHAGELILEKIRLETLIAGRKAQKVKKKVFENEFESKKSEFENFKKVFENNQANNAEINQKAKEKKGEEIKQLYRELAKKIHPDKFAQDADLYKRATELMAEINMAYENNDFDAMIHLRDMIGNGAFENLEMWKSTWSSTYLEKSLVFWQEKKRALLQALEKLQNQTIYDIFIEKVGLDAYVAQLKTELESDIRILNDNLNQYTP
jgi:hypothetical protein